MAATGQALGHIGNLENSTKAGISDNSAMKLKINKYRKPNTSTQQEIKITNYGNYENETYKHMGEARTPQASEKTARWESTRLQLEKLEERDKIAQESKGMPWWGQKLMEWKRSTAQLFSNTKSWIFEKKFRQ